VRGFDITVDATALTASTLSVNGESSGFVPTSTPVVITRIPGSKGFSSSVLTFTFVILDDGTLDYDPSLDSQVLGRGTTTLTVQ
jgi:hypothetical protein